MSQKKHKGNHGQRAELRAVQSRSLSQQSSASADKPRRVYLRNPLHIWATLGIIAAVIAVLIGFELLGWWDHVVGTVLVVPLVAFGCMCVYDLALLLSACMTFGGGMVNAGKDDRGQPMVFHASAVLRVEVRDKADRPLPDDAPAYKGVSLAFVMESGRVNRRPVGRLSHKQLTAIRAALEAEQKNAPSN